ncbi:MAG: glycosyltransferase family 2 protein [Leptolyngbya sp. SIO3F4]|nr:glycosyltransferase family 2 protein [Leptolyngbya sp. SIO3F4]
MTTPSLSICIPAYNRPRWLGRALSSILTTSPQQQQQVEIIVSDDSTIAECQQVTHKLLANWQGSHRYHRNSPSLGMAANWNQCIHLASGNFLLILHDDDYLEPKAVEQILAVVQKNHEYKALLFGVNVVTPEERVQKQQQFYQQQYLPQKDAIKQILFDSSFVRFPGMLLHRDVFEQIGYFDELVGGIADIHLWVRVFEHYGVLCLPVITANYTVHSQALTMDMFKMPVVNELLALFDWAENHQLLDVKTLEYCKANYFHQFVLAGTVRYIRLGKFRQAHSVLTLLNSLNIKHNLAIRKWKLIRWILSCFLKPVAILGS